MKYGIAILIAASVLAVGLSTLGSSVAIAQGAFGGELHGVRIIVMKRNAAATSAVNGVPYKEAATQMAKALNVIKDLSPFLWDRLSRVKRSATPVIGYDPGEPLGDKRDSYSLVQYDPPSWIARGLGSAVPSYLSHRALRMAPEELAVFVAFQLVGQGTQRFERRFSSDPTLNQECEARLYMERAVQDFGLDKGDKLWVGMRRGMDDRFCEAFIDWLRANHPGAADTFDTRDPDIPMLLDLFQAYRKS